jgi:hypothetical protein
MTSPKHILPVEYLIKMKFAWNWDKLPSRRSHSKPFRIRFCKAEARQYHNPKDPLNKSAGYYIFLSFMVLALGKS